MKEDPYIILSMLPEIGATTAMRLLSKFGTPEAIFSASKAELMSVERVGEKVANSVLENAKNLDIQKIRANIADVGASFIPINSNEYPQKLKTLSDSPVGLYSIGKTDLNAPCISIVGSRICTVYGQNIARKFASFFARAGFTVVSGMARGIDTSAHIGALEAGGKTIAVLGCGADIIYPPENANLYKKITNSGAVISEFPLGTRADKQTFPIRNRIIAGMSLATVIVESDIRGGSMITARLAAEQGRDVFAVPGRIDSNASRGCHALIKDGAFLASSPEDVLDALSFAGQLNLNLTPTEQNIPQHTSLSLSEDESNVFTAIAELGDASADEISLKANIPIQKCLACLLMLEIKKLISKTPLGTWQKRIS